MTLRERMKDVLNDNGRRAELFLALSYLEEAFQTKVTLCLKGDEILVLEEVSEQEVDSIIKDFSPSRLKYGNVDLRAGKD